MSFAASPLMSQIARRAASSSLTQGGARGAASAITRTAAANSGTATTAASGTIASEAVFVEPYNHAMKFFHWATAGGIMTCIGTVQTAMYTKDSDLKAKMMNIHKSTGLLVAGLVLGRIGTRLMSKVPGHYPGLHRVEELAADAGHYALYAMMMAMPATGIAMGYYGGKGLPFFGSHIAGADKTKPEVAKTAFMAHKKIGQALELLIPGHVGAVGLHMLRGQNVLGRMAGAFR